MSKTYSQLQAAVTSTFDHYIIIVLGNFNKHVSSNFKQWGSVTDPHRFHEWNEKSEYLLDICAFNNLIITSTWFQHKFIHQLTWYRNGKKKLQKIYKCTMGVSVPSLHRASTNSLIGV